MNPKIKILILQRFLKENYNVKQTIRNNWYYNLLNVANSEIIGTATRFSNQEEVTMVIDNLIGDFQHFDLIELEC